MTTSNSFERYVLIIIDMQPYFMASQKPRVITNVQREITSAITDNQLIFIVEFSNCGETDYRLLELLRGYTRKSLIYKNHDDGSSEITEEFRRKAPRSSLLKVCGVNTDACVYSTVRGLKTTMPHTEIQVIVDACNSDESHSNGLKKLQKLKNVRKFGEMI